MAGLFDFMSNAGELQEAIAVLKDASHRIPATIARIEAEVKATNTLLQEIVKQLEAANAARGK
jgi:HAMP domain-containing protein